MSTLLLNAVLAVSMMAAQKSATDCLSYFPTGDGFNFGYSSDDAGGATSYLGVDTRNLTPDRISALQLKDDNGVEVTMVDQDAPAGKAGIKEQDVILSVNGTSVQSVEQLRRLIREIPPGRVVTLGVVRGGQPLTLQAELADRKQSVMVFPKVNVQPFKFNMQNMPVVADMDIPVSVVVVHSSARSGLMVENLTPQLGAFFGTKNGEGVLVRSVEKGSAAEKAGFHAGDVILKVNGETVNDTGDFSHNLRGKDNTATVVVLRDRKEQTLTLTLPERKRSGLSEESFELPEVNEQAAVALADQVRIYAAQLKPEIMMQYAEEMKRLQPEMDKLARQAREQSKQMQKQMEKMQQEMQEQLKEYHLGGHADI